MKNIFVGNLNFGATEAAVRSLFEAYGAVERVNIVTDRDTGQARGFGFVEMTTNAEADRAIAELNGRELDGRALNVNETRPKTDRGFSGGGGGGGGRGLWWGRRWRRPLLARSRQAEALPHQIRLRGAAPAGASPLFRSRQGTTPLPRPRSVDDVD